MDNDVYVVYYKRTAFSRSRPKEPERDVFNSTRMDVAYSKLIEDALNSTGIDPHEINDVITGCAYQRDENWTYGGRHPVFLSKLPYDVPSMAVDRACASSMNAVSIGVMEIAGGSSEVVFAGGFEHMTHIPRLSNKLCNPLLEDSEYSDYRMKEAYNMGLTAENLAELRRVTRAEMDRFALESHKKANESTESGWQRKEILPLEVETVNGKMVVDKDQSIRGDTSMQQLAALPPTFKENGTVTAGNSSPLNAGASLVVLASGRKVKEYGLKPMSKISGFGWAAVPPYLMGLGPVPASLKVLKRFGLKAEDIDIWEINEAFAVVVINAIRELGLNEGNVNIKGGAIAIGHPLGATGARLIGTLSRLLEDRGKERGIATLCVGGGQGYSALIERY
ncbi:MAG: acetyl-CoA C-acetyltransferase [Candidatus Thermoplasmatota archaeon]|nr:acetyl-CoA C-acetyltransferase [Candidatus Thermoplasmatota archaeon]